MTLYENRKGICCVAGCNNSIKAQRLCGKHYERNRVHGDPLYRLPHYNPNPPKAGRIKYKHVKTPLGTQYEHILLAEKALGKPLPPGAVVHHLDGNGLNNQSNLVICPNQAYHALLHKRARELGYG